MLAAIVLLAGAWTFIRFKTAGHTWEVSHDCGDRGPLSDGDFIKAAVAQSITPSKVAPYYRQFENLKQNYVFAEKFISDNPDCCSIYRGSPNDYFSPETFEQYMTRTFAKVVKINFMAEDRSDGGLSGRPRTYYVKLDACGNQLD